MFHGTVGSCFLRHVRDSARVSSGVRYMSAQGTRKIFADFDLEQFWKKSDYALNEYVGAPLTDETVLRGEKDLGYHLPPAYVELMRYQNGGNARRTNHRTKERTSWSHDHIAITGLYSIGREKRCSLCDEF